MAAAVARVRQALAASSATAPSLVGMPAILGPGCAGSAGPLLPPPTATPSLASSIAATGGSGGSVGYSVAGCRAGGSGLAPCAPFAGASAAAAGSSPAGNAAGARSTVAVTGPLLPLPTGAGPPLSPSPAPPLSPPLALPDALASALLSLQSPSGSACPSPLLGASPTLGSAAGGQPQRQQLQTHHPLLTTGGSTLPGALASPMLPRARRPIPRSRGSSVDWSHGGGSGGTGGGGGSASTDGGAGRGYSETNGGGADEASPFGEAHRSPSFSRLTSAFHTTAGPPYGTSPPAGRSSVSALQLAPACPAAVAPPPRSTSPSITFSFGGSLAPQAHAPPCAHGSSLVPAAAAAAPGHVPSASRSGFGEGSIPRTVSTTLSSSPPSPCSATPPQVLLPQQTHPPLPQPPLHACTHGDAGEATVVGAVAAALRESSTLALGGGPAGEGPTWQGAATSSVEGSLLSPPPPSERPLSRSATIAALLSAQAGGSVAPFPTPLPCARRASQGGCPVGNADDGSVTPISGGGSSAAGSLPATRVFAADESPPTQRPPAIDAPALFACSPSHPSSSAGSQQRARASPPMQPPRSPPSSAPHLDRLVSPPPGVQRAAAASAAALGTPPQSPHAYVSRAAVCQGSAGPLARDAWARHPRDTRLSSPGAGAAQASTGGHGEIPEVESEQLTPKEEAGATAADGCPTRPLDSLAPRAPALQHSASFMHPAPRSPPSPALAFSMSPFSSSAFGASDACTPAPCSSPPTSPPQPPLLAHAGRHAPALRGVDVEPRENPFAFAEDLFDDVAASAAARRCRAASLPSGVPPVLMGLPRSPIATPATGGTPDAVTSPPSTAEVGMGSAQPGCSPRSRCTPAAADAARGGDESPAPMSPVRRCDTSPVASPPLPVSPQPHVSPTPPSSPPHTTAQQPGCVPPHGSPQASLSGGGGGGGGDGGSVASVTLAALDKSSCGAPKETLARSRSVAVIPRFVAPRSLRSAGAVAAPGGGGGAGANSTGGSQGSEGAHPEGSPPPQPSPQPRLGNALPLCSEAALVAAMRAQAGGELREWDEAPDDDWVLFLVNDTRAPVFRCYKGRTFQLAPHSVQVVARGTGVLFDTAHVESYDFVEITLVPVATPPPPTPPTLPPTPMPDTAAASVAPTLEVSVSQSASAGPDIPPPPIPPIVATPRTPTCELRPLSVPMLAGSPDVANTAAPSTPPNLPASSPTSPSSASTSPAMSTATSPTTTTNSFSCGAVSAAADDMNGSLLAVPRLPPPRSPGVPLSPPMLPALPSLSAPPMVAAAAPAIPVGAAAAVPPALLATLEPAVAALNGGYDSAGRGHAASPSPPTPPMHRRASEDLPAPLSPTALVPSVATAAAVRPRSVTLPAAASNAQRTLDALESAPPPSETSARVGVAAGTQASSGLVLRMCKQGRKRAGPRSRT